MRDLMGWSFPIGRLFGIAIRVHILFPLVAAALLLRQISYQPPQGFEIPKGAWIDILIVEVLLFIAVLLHEFGHCFGARLVYGDAREILMWPLGGLAYVEVPHTPRANLITAIAGPLVNLFLCLLCMGLLLVVPLGPIQPSWNIFPSGFPARDLQQVVKLTAWSGEVVALSPYSLTVFIDRFFWINALLFAFNIILVGYPMDSGRILQSLLWPYMGYRQATLYSVFAGFFVVIALGIYAVAQEQMLALFLAIWIYVECNRQWIIVETGGDEALGGYDFSQGYTSLERDAPPLKGQPSWWERWRQRRAEQKALKELETREADERRMDSLLEKISSEGMAALTDEERRFMKQFSDRYKNRR